MAKYKKSNNAELDILMLCILPIFGVISSLLFRLNFLESSLVLFGSPAFYLSLRTKQAILRTVVFSTIIAVLGGITIDYLAFLDSSWAVPTIFPYRILGAVPIEDIVWAFLLTYLTSIFYEHFFDKGKHKIFDPHIKYLFFVCSILFSMLIILLTFKKSLLHISYFYLWCGLFIVVIPIMLTLIGSPKSLIKILKVSPYFISLALLNEIIGLQMGYWSFKGIHFIGWVILFGLKFPFEEFLFFIILFSTSILTYFEFYDDSVHARFNFLKTK